MKQFYSRTLKLFTKIYSDAAKHILALLAHDPKKAKLCIFCIIGKDKRAPFPSNTSSA